MNTKPQSDPLGSSRLMFWQPIETAPKDGTEILVAVRYPNKGFYETFFASWVTVLAEYPAGVWGFSCFDPITYGTPNHWMEVPRYVEPENKP